MRDISLAEEMVQEGCSYLATLGLLNEEALQPYLGVNEPVACR
jgi:hypothetical protein